MLDRAEEMKEKLKAISVPIFQFKDGSIYLTTAIPTPSASCALR